MSAAGDCSFIPWELDSQLSCRVPGLVLPPISTTPVPFGVAVIDPFAPSVMVIVPEFVPEFVSKIKSYAPLDVIVDAADPVPTTISPDPFGDKAKSMFESSPAAATFGSPPVAAFVTF